MSGSDILKEIIGRKGGKIWVCKRIGRRISYIDGLKVGEEQYVPPKVLYDDGDYVVFSEGIDADDWVISKLEELVSVLREERK